MKRTLIRYKTKPDLAQENQRLIESVFAELEAKSPDGVRYLVFALLTARSCILLPSIQK